MGKLTPCLRWFWKAGWEQRLWLLLHNGLIKKLFKNSGVRTPALRLGDWDSINLEDCQDVCAFSSSPGDSDTKGSLRINEVAQRLVARGLGSGALRLKINAAIHYLCCFSQATVPWALLPAVWWCHGRGARRWTKNARHSKSSARAAITTTMSAFGDRLKGMSKVRFSLHPDTLTRETFRGLDALCPSLRDPYSLGQPNQVVQTKALKGLLQKGKSPFCFMNMVLEISLYQNSHSFIWGTVTHFISLIPLSAPKCMLSSHLQRRKALRPKGLPGGAKWVVPQAPQHSPRLEAQIPAVKAEGSHIMPGNKLAAAAGQPEAPFRSFILLGRSLFLGGGRRGRRLWLKRNLRLTQLVLSLIQTKQEVPSLVAWQCPGGTNGRAGGTS